MSIPAGIANECHETPSPGDFAAPRNSAAGIALALGVAVGAVGVAGPAQARPALKLPPRSAAVSWGDNQDGQLGNGSTTASATYAGVSGLSSGVAQVSAGHDDNSMALMTDGTVWTWGWGRRSGPGRKAAVGRGPRAGLITGSDVEPGAMRPAE
jgi:Regulator of chromosome condensation (RCC1) repeat